MGVPAGLLLARGSAALAGQEPSSLSGLIAWYKASDIAQADASAVTSWADKSGNGHTLAQATGTKQPTYRTGVVNGQPVVRFDGGDILFQDGATGLPTTAFTIFLVVRDTSGSGAAEEPFHLRRASDGNPIISLISSGTGATFLQRIRNNSATLRDTATKAASQASFHVIEGGWVAGSNVVVSVDGGAEGTATDPGGSMTLDQMSLGGARQNTTDAAFLTGDIAEAAIYSSFHNQAARADVRARLGARYGITVA